MLYALLVVCAADAAVCDVEHAVYAAQSPPIFDTIAACERGALEHLKETWSATGLRSDAKYHVDISCEKAEPSREA